MRDVLKCVLSSFFRSQRRLLLGSLFFAFFFILFSAKNVSCAPTLDEMLGSMIMCGFREADILDSPLLPLIRDGRIGHVILFDKDRTTGKRRNILSPLQVKHLTKTLRENAPSPMLIALDQEGGRVQRLTEKRGFHSFPSARSMGQESLKKTEETAFQMGKELSDLGINVNFAPCADVETKENGRPSLIGQQDRSFGSDAKMVAEHVCSFGRGLLRAHVLPTLKHFPGLGCAEKDTHLSRADISQCFRVERDLLPYVIALDRHWPGLIMVSHASHDRLDPELPASLSRSVITHLLRENMGFYGVVISDDLQMDAIRSHFTLEESIKKAVLAGVDILLFGNNHVWDPSLPVRVHSTLRNLVEKGVIPRERIEESWMRIQALFQSIEDFR